MCTIKTINLPCVLLLFCERFLPGSIDRQAARSGFCWAGYTGTRVIRALWFLWGLGITIRQFPNGLRTLPEFLTISELFWYPDPTKTRTRGWLWYPAQQKPDRAACRPIEPKRIRLQNKSKTQGKFIVFIGHMRDVGAPCAIIRASVHLVRARFADDSFPALNDAHTHYKFLKTSSFWTFLILWRVFFCFKFFLMLLFNLFFSYARFLFFVQ